MELNFGVSVKKLDRRLLPFLKELGVDHIEILFHRGIPSPEVLEIVQAMNIRVFAKYVPSRKDQMQPEKMFNRMDRIISPVRSYIDAWDFGGEPETRPDQPGCRWYLDSNAFLEMYKSFRDLVRTNNSEIKVGGSGFITPTFDGYWGNDDRSGFFQELLGKGFKDYVDFLSFNHYVYGYGGEKSLVSGIVKIMGILDRYNVDVPLRIAEMGVPCDGDPAFYHIIQSRENQADSLIRLFALFFANGISFVTWFDLIYEGFGLLDHDLCRRPSFEALKGMIKTFRDFKFDTQVKAFPLEREETDCYTWLRFRKGDLYRDIVWMDRKHFSEWKLPENVKARRPMQSDIEGVAHFSYSPIFLEGTGLKGYIPIQIKQ